MDPVRPRLRPGGPDARDERGGSTAILAAIIAPMLLVLVGLVVDGGGQLAAVRQAEAVAAQAARAGADAVIGAAVAGAGAEQRARAAALEHLQRAGVEGTVTVADGVVTVTTSLQHDAVFLGLIGINQLTGTGEASARIVPG